VTELELLEAVPLAHAAVARAAADIDVRVLFFKGPVAALQGLRPERASQDVDALVDPARLSELTSALTGLDWVDEHLYSTPTAATYSRTHRHASWPCELDLHTTFPGLFAPEQDAFELLWSRRESVEVAAQEVPCPDPQAHALLLALNSLRDPHETTKTSQLADLVRRVSGSFDQRALLGLGRLAGELGAADTAAPFLNAVGAPNDGIGSTAQEDLHAWRLRTQPAWRVATWVEGLRQRPLRSWPGYLWYALALSDEELRMADPNLPPGRRALAGARWRRLKRGAAALPRAVRTMRAVNHDSRHASDAAATGATQTTWRSLPIPPGVTRVAAGVLGLLDRAVVRKRGVLIRTFPDFDDQGFEMARALADAGVRPIVWLVKSSMTPDASVLERLPTDTWIVNAGSWRGVLEYARARVVVHTHGLYAEPSRSSGKLFVNVWHGWGTKQLEQRPEVVRQSDLVTATSNAAADAIAEAWGIGRQQVEVTGLPRTDALLRASSMPRPEALRRLIPDDGSLVVWLPTYRRSLVGHIRTDGIDFGNDFQLPRCRRADVARLAEGLDTHILLKTHPMAATHDLGDQGRLSIWDNDALASSGLSLYELLGHADVLVTDYSSVWVDYLLLNRPIVFTMADREEYARSRGVYASLTDEHELPGPVVGDVVGLRRSLLEALHDGDPWASRREAVTAGYHEWSDAGSAARVAALITARIADRSGRRETGPA
jgi:CDP-glycerol glycerophosphotransferase (TagB/SpsB family)